MQYVAKIVEEDGQFCVTFPDIPEAITFGKTLGMALLNAHDVLHSAMEFYLEDDRPVPLPSYGYLGIVNFTTFGDSDWSVSLDEVTVIAIAQSVGFLHRAGGVQRMDKHGVWIAVT